MFADRLARLTRRFWRGLLTGLALGALVGLALSFLVTPRYTAHADVLLVPTPGASAADAIDDRVLESYALLLGGRRIASTVQDTTGSDRTVASIDRSLDARVRGDSTVLRVTATDPDAATAAARSAAAVQAFSTLLIDAGNAVPRADAGDSGDEESDDEESGAPAPDLVVTVIEESPVPTVPSSPDRVRWALLGALVGALLGLAGTALRQVTDRRIRSTEDLEDATGSPVLGAFGFDRATPSTPLVSDLDTHHPRFEASRILRTNLQFLDVDSSDRIFTFTSCTPSEGKTTVTANVAVALARGGQSVVLVEGDLRRPTLAGLFDVPAGIGLTTTLIGQVTLDEAIQTTSVPGLDLLTSGAVPPNPAELLQTHAMADLLTTLAGQYDLVLIDAPPLLPVTDAALLATRSDGAVLVVRHGRTTREQVRRALDRLDTVGARLLGAVLTMTPARGATKYEYGYGYSTESPTPATAAEEGRRVRRED